MPICTAIKKNCGQKIDMIFKIRYPSKVYACHKFALLQSFPKEFITKAIKKAQVCIGQLIKITLSPFHDVNDLNRT